MDINNYSYINSTGRSQEIASSIADYDFPVVFFELEQNYFGDYFYYVYHLLDDAAETFDFSTLDNGESERAAYAKAAAFYNSLVPDRDAIPLF